ncbi:unnamed protein product [Owenia fusiformis]|uniref:Major facilitator superfamily (MFS) profile domain-containing protein n=1 Tax=Owenia fusiformis TaxID=6347 RepID=A0A8S4PH08_OWEFU|nr:unnamed protein product [Owenia fusiformis]
MGSRKLTTSSKVQKEHNRKTRNDKDGGYGWFIVLLSMFAHIITYGVSWTVGVFFVLFLNAFHATKGVTAWAGSLNTACLYIVGPVSSILINKFGCRPVVILGGAIAAVGLGTSALATNIYHLYISFGVVTGVGFGIAYIPYLVIVNHYFHKKRSIAVGIAVSGIGFGSFIYPPLIETLTHHYGWRGMLIILSGITLNLCVIGAFMRPFKDMDQHKNQMKVKERVFNIDIFRSLDFLLLCLNNLLFSFGLSGVYSHLSEYSLVMGIGGPESSMLFSVIGISNLIGRFMIGFIGSHPVTNAILLYIGAFSVSAIATLCLPLFTQYGTLISYAVIFGWSSASFGVLLPGITCKFLGLEELASGYGVLLPFNAIGTMLGGPVAGFLYDILHSYNASFIVLGSAMLLSAVLMVVPYWRERRRPESILNVDPIKKVKPNVLLDETHHESDLDDSIGKMELDDLPNRTDVHVDI